MPSLNTGNAILSNALKVDSSYNVGIGGAASGSYKLQVTGNVNADNFIIQPTGYGLLASLSRDLTGSGFGVLNLKNGSNGFIQPAALSVDRTYTLPDATGTIALTSNLSAYLPLSGGTLTGALSGTSATFSTQLKVLNSTGSALDMLVLETGFNNPSGNKSIIWKDATSPLGRISVSYDASTGSTMRFGSLYNGGYQTSDLLTIASTGAATFSSSVTVNSSTTGTQTVANFAAANYSSPSSRTYIQIGTQFGDGSSRIGSVNTTGNQSALIFQSHSATADVWNDAMYINGSGNVGIGITPNTWAGTNTKALQVYLGSMASSLTFGTAFTFNSYYDGSWRYTGSFSAGKYEIGGNEHIWYSAPDGTAGNVATFAERMRITSGGYLKLREATASTTEVHILRADTTTDAVVQVNNSNNSQASDGLLSIIATRNTSNNTFYAFGYYNAGAGAWKIRVADSGNVTNTNGSYGTISSDIRLKENIKPATPKLDDLLKLNVVNFNLIGNEEKHIGFIAQEMQEVFPSFVYQSDTRKYDEDGNLISGLEDALGVKVGMEFAVLVKAIQELKAEIDEQQQTINSLINR